MAVTAHVYPKFMLAIATKTVSLTADTFKTGLCTGDASAWTTGAVWGYQYIAAVIGAYTEVGTGGGYTSGHAGRLALTTFTCTQQAAVNDSIISWTCTNPAPISFGASTTITARSMFIYDDSIGTTDADTPVATIIDFGQSVSSTNGPFTYTVEGTPHGLAYWTCS